MIQQQVKEDGKKILAGEMAADGTAKPIGGQVPPS
jgi:hypothetical protein